MYIVRFIMCTVSHDSLGEKAKQMTNLPVASFATCCELFLQY